ncbi:MAG: leucyl aminopeptidase family protein, partial [Caulobacteraceae bacterium]
MSDVLIPAEEAVNAVPVTLVTAEGLEAVLGADAALGPLARAQGFKAKAGSLLVVPGEAGAARALYGLGDEAKVEPNGLRGLAAALPEGDYALEALPEGWNATLAATAFALGS